MRVRAAGVNPVDAYIRSGTYARKPPAYTPGTDGAGEVEAVGADVNGFKPGDRVYIAGDNVALAGAGTYAEQALCAPTQLHRLPAARHVRPGRGARRAVRHGLSRAVHARQRAAGRDRARARRDRRRRHRRRAARARARHDGHRHRRHRRGLRARARAGRRRRRQPPRARTISTRSWSATGGRGVDVILEMAAHINLDKDLALLARNGRIVVIGNRGRVEIDPRGRRWHATPRSSA